MISDQHAFWQTGTPLGGSSVSFREDGTKKIAGATVAEPTNTSEEVPMQIGRTRLTPEERQKHLAEGRCLYFVAALAIWLLPVH